MYSHARPQTVASTHCSTLSESSRQVVLEIQELELEVLINALMSDMGTELQTFNTQNSAVT